ncbi:gtpase inhibitor [Pyrrhoderma noxium]|uniref:Gtpase inhibitor n=1 Tax=Pyrrhoderma noxium TaxID=2282107 RepID=A0A286UMU7_9AGAM|nr:gtpase inhibitor [Pyrrhoderma noxium]
MSDKGHTDTSTSEAHMEDDEIAKDSDDELFDELEREIDNDFDLGALREQRIEELKQEMNKLKDMREKEHGQLTEILDEKEAIRISANEKRCVIHFYHRDFKRCDIMNKHLEEIALKYISTRFLKVFVENVPWLVEKLQVKVLPCVFCFIDGVTKDRLIGFEDLGNSDGFETAALELRLQMCGVIDKPGVSQPVRTMYSSNSSRFRGDSDEDSDSD